MALQKLIIIIIIIIINRRQYGNTGTSTLHKMTATDLTHGIKGKLLSVIGNWLSNRKQRVCIKGRWSNWISVWSGVLQGSVLGPLLFLIFINDLDKDISSNMLKFADDTKIFKEVRNSTDCSRLQADLDKLVLWAQKWQTEFNVNKCKVMHVGNSDDCSTYYK